MAFTTVPTVVAGSLATAAWANTYLRDNINWLKDNLRPTSIQRGSASYASGGTSGTGSITAVASTAVCEIDKLGDALPVCTPTLLNISSVALTNTTTVTATRTSGQDGGSANIAGTVQFQVTEW